MLIAAKGWAGHRSADGEQLYSALLVFLGVSLSLPLLFIIIIIITIFHFVSIIKLLLLKP